MVSGKPYSKREKEYIAKHKDELSYRYMAEQLSELFPEDNLGHRDRLSVRKHAKKLEEVG